ncbi:hypothetical protein FRC05_004009 [Tulasnella sp. 425]|nr:hypothetical protein FRC05_004009 [Tulasnella sp. 425]
MTNVIFSVSTALAKIASAFGLSVWDGVNTKRLEALRDPEVVKEMQRRIKVHLASNNMIKGSARSSVAATPDHTPFSSTPPYSWHPSPSSDRSSEPLDASPLPPLHSIMTTAPHPSTPSSDIPGGVAGGAGTSYGGQSFLSFADLIGTNASSDNEAQSSASSRKGKTRQAKHAPVESPVEESSDDGFGEDELPEDEPGPDEGASSFSRHSPGYPQPNYDPPQYRPRYPYEMGSPPQQPPYHAHAPHPYAQPDPRTQPHKYDNERDMRVDDSLRKAERDRETDRPQVPNGNLPRPPYEPNVGYPAFPGHDFIYGPGVGAASAGRALAGYTQFGHAGYRGPSPSDSLNSSFASGPPPPKTDPFYSGPRLAMMDARHGTAALPGPPLSMSIGRSGGTSPTSDQYLQPMEHNPNGITYNESGYRSPNPPPGRSPMGAGMTSSRGSISHQSGETTEEAADVEPIPNPHQLSAGTSASTQVDIKTAYTSSPYIPGGSSFGPSYSFDKTFQDSEPNK